MRSFKQNMAPEDILEKLTSQEACLQQTYANFRPQLDGKAVSENQIREILQKEINPEKRRQAWEASKQIGELLALADPRAGEAPQPASQKLRLY